MLRVSVGFVALAGVLALPASTAPGGARFLGSGIGELTGNTAPCYGPGPNLNLEPVVTVRAERTDGQVRSVLVVNTDAHHTYRLRLPAGLWTVSSNSGRVYAIVRADRTTSADLPPTNCL